MGLAGAGAVLIAVAVSTTLLPAMMGFAGEWLCPKPGSRAARRERATQQPDHGGRRPSGERWGRAAVRRPMPTLLAVLVGLLAVAVPARTSSPPYRTTAPRPSTAPDARRTTSSRRSSAQASTACC
ncbi:MMPL family transporter [Streptomyces sp. NPDC042638]|uniref:MMPL family transporter n=1 Tax=Streptomyces sp. NPDC042638 TaxID=3154333 RepID=UPI0033E6200A